MSAVATWADGFGRWHAAVPEGVSAPVRVARVAIRRQLVARGQIGPGYAVRVVPVPGARSVFVEV